MSDLSIKSVWEVTCKKADGKVRWHEVVENKVVDEGLAFLLDTVFRGSAYNAAWYMGLKGAGGALVDDTLASHPLWAEIADYVGTRKPTTFNAPVAGAMNNAGLRPAFDMNITTTLYGMFLCTAASGSSGTLMSVIDFVAPRPVTAGDTLYVLVTYNLYGG